MMTISYLPSNNVLISDNSRVRKNDIGSNIIHNENSKYTATVFKRIAVVEWLERLGYGAGSVRKVLCSRLGFAMR